MLFRSCSNSRSRGTFSPALAGLESIWFVRGDAQAEEYWSFVHHCRTGGDHARAGQWYDIAIGPLASSWRSRLTFLGADQISFHTTGAERILNASGRHVL